MEDQELVRFLQELVEYLVIGEYERARYILLQYRDVPYFNSIEEVQRVFYKKFRVSFRRFKVREHELWVLDYNKYVKEWDPVQRSCRGTYIVVGKDGSINYHFSFTKFFNLNEKWDWSIEYLSDWDVVEVTRKADGTLIIHFMDDLLGEVLGTRSLPHFVSVGPESATSLRGCVEIKDMKIRNPYIQLMYKYFGVPKIGSTVDTYMYELVVPSQTGSKMSQYFEKEKNLYFLTVRKGDRLLRYSDALEYQPEGTVAIESYPLNDIQKLEELMKDIDFEGWVVRFEKGEYYKLVKVKNPKAFILEDISKKTVVRSVIQGTIDDLYPYLSNELKKYAEEVQALIPLIEEVLEKVIELCKSAKNKQHLKQILRTHKLPLLVSSKYLYEYIKGEISREEVLYRILEHHGFDLEKLRSTLSWYLG